MTVGAAIPTGTDSTPRIIVIGVGGGGTNAVDNMISMNLRGVEFVVADADAQQLLHSRADRRIQLGPHLTRGAGAKPEIGRTAAEESADKLYRHLDGADMAFITAGMGGGTGTAAAPLIARMARERSILTVGVVTKPFTFEGTHRADYAAEGIEELRQCVDTLIVISNQNLFHGADERGGWKEAFKMTDEVLYRAVRCVTDLMMMPGLVNLDFADIRTVMSQMGKAMVGTGEVGGENRAIRAAELAINNPLLENNDISAARGLLINVTGGEDMTLFEVDQAANRIREEVDEEANIIFGSAIDASLHGKVRVTVIATGITQPSKRFIGDPGTNAAPSQAPNEEELGAIEINHAHLDPIPAQGAGPHFNISHEGRIRLEYSSAVNGGEKHDTRIGQLLPVVRRAAKDAAAHVSANQFPELARDLVEYINSISRDDKSIPWGLVYGLGVMLENSVAAARREIDGRLRPSLEDTAQSALESLLTLHGPLLLATAEGRELQEQADRLRMTHEEHLLLRSEAVALASRLSRNTEVIEPEAAQVIAKAAATIGAGRHADRGTAYGIGTVKNVAGILVTAAALAALVPAGITIGGTSGGVAGAGLAWIAYESVKKSARFATATAALGSHFDRALELGEEKLYQLLNRLAPFSQFVLENEDSLRRISNNTVSLRWILPYLDFIVRSSGRRQSGPVRPQ